MSGSGSTSAVDDSEAVEAVEALGNGCAVHAVGGGEVGNAFTRLESLADARFVCVSQDCSFGCNGHGCWRERLGRGGDGTGGTALV
jgi:hypothetical protein